MAGLVPAIHEHKRCRTRHCASRTCSSIAVFMDRRDEPGDDGLVERKKRPRGTSRGRFRFQKMLIKTD
jgi:hypothetical protein